MFMIFKNNKPAGTTRFLTYEKARQTLRKRLRKVTAFRLYNQPAVTLGDLGYSIKAV